MTVEYKPPHKLSVENLCAGLRPMEFWEEVVNSEVIPTDGAEKLRHNAARLTGSVLVQEFHVMIQEGLSYSCVSTGIAMVFLHVPEDDPATLYYYLCVPNKDAQSEIEDYPQHPVTAVARLLCLCLMSCRTSPRSNTWRNRAKNELHLWETDFEYARSQIPDEQLDQTPPASEYVPSSPFKSSTPESPRRVTRSHARCTPPSGTIRNDDSDPSDSDSHSTGPQRKRKYSEVASSPPQLMPPPPTAKQSEGHQRQHSISSFCTQRCLLGLQQGGLLDESCPNFVEHRGGKEVDRHPIAASELVALLKQQLDLDLDHYCDPFGSCGAYGAPFKIRCASYGYTLVGKGTTPALWGIVSREAAVYEVLRTAQGSAVPVFLGSIDLKQKYFLHGAGEIRHMLLMAWGGEPITDEQWKSSAIHHSNREIRKLGVWHCDLRRQNVLWSAELKRMILIDFHSCKPMAKHVGSLRRKRVTLQADNQVYAKSSRAP